MTDHSKLVERLRVRAQIRRQIPTRKSVQEGKPDRIADLLEEAATALESRSDDYKRGLEDAAKIAGKKGGFHHIGDDAVYWNGYSRGREEAEAEIRAKIKGGGRVGAFERWATVVGLRGGNVKVFVVFRGLVKGRGGGG